jgi:hypothetical protein
MIQQLRRPGFRCAHSLSSLTMCPVHSAIDCILLCPNAALVLELRTSVETAKNGIRMDVPSHEKPDRATFTIMILHVLGVCLKRTYRCATSKTRGRRDSPQKWSRNTRGQRAMQGTGQPTAQPRASAWLGSQAYRYAAQGFGVLLDVPFSSTCSSFKLT